MSIKEAVEDFTQRLRALLEGQAMERAKAAVLDAFGLDAPKRRGRPPKALSASSVSTKDVGAKASTKRRKPRKKPPLQLCPVPGCKNPAAPIFGMVCATHKNVAKSKIRKYREARKAKKMGLPVAKAKPAKRKKASKRKLAKASAAKAVAVKTKAKRTKSGPRRMAKRSPPKTRSKTVSAAVAKPVPMAAPSVAAPAPTPLPA
jgi:hypothetical protein